MSNHYLNIAIISFHTCPLADTEGLEIGGMNTYVKEQALEMAKLGHIVDVFTRSHGANLKPIEHICPNLRIIHLPAGENKHIPPNRLNSYILEFSHHFKEFINSRSLVYDIFHSHYYLSGLVALNLKNEEQYRNIPLVITFHTMGLMKNLIARTPYEKENTQRINAELLLTKMANQIIVNCEAEKNYLKFLYQTDVCKISVISPGINNKIFNKTEAFPVNTTNEPFKILFVGRINALKGIDHLLYALKIITNKYPKKFSLIIMGGNKEEYEKNPEFKLLVQIIKQLDIDAEIQFLAQSNHHELSLIYQQSNVLILPSYYETFGLVALESMACGIPVIVTENCGISELIRKQVDPSLVVPPANPLALASSIENLFNQKDLYLNRSEQVYFFAQNYTWQKTAKKLLDSFQVLINAE